MNTHPHKNNFVQSTTFGTFGDKYVIVMVGLPARGKSYTAKKLSWYLQFVHGCNCKIFNLGNYRRIQFQNTTIEDFNPKNNTGLQIRQTCAELAMKDLKNFFNLESKKGLVGIFDATNSTCDRRQWILTQLKNIPVIFIENIITEAEIEKKNLLSKLNNSDFNNITNDIVLLQFNKRIKYYKSIYQSMENKNLSWIKVINAGKQIIINKMNGYLLGKIATFVSNLKINFEKIYLSRHGQSNYNLQGLIGGDSCLTNKGIEYAKQLAKWVSEQKLDNPQKKTRLWLSTMKRTAETIQFFPNSVINNWEILRPKKWSCLDEIHAGQMDGFTYNQIKELFPQDYALRKKNKLSYRYPGGESYLDLISRLEPVLLEIESSQVPIIIVAHNAVLRIIYSYLMHIPREESVHLEFKLNTLREIEPRKINCSEKIFKL